MEIVFLLLEMAIKQYKNGKVAVGDQCLACAYKIREYSWNDQLDKAKKPFIPPIKKS